MKYKKGNPKYKEGQFYLHNKYKFLIRLGKKVEGKFIFEVIRGINPNIGRYGQVTVEQWTGANSDDSDWAISYDHREIAVSPTTLYRLYTRASNAEVLYDKPK